MAASFRLTFRDDSLKVKLEERAKRFGMSTNEFINLVLSAQFDDKDRRTYDLMQDIVNLDNEK